MDNIDTAAALQLIEISTAGYSHTHGTGYSCGMLVAISRDTVTVTVQSVDRAVSKVLTYPRHLAPALLDCVEAMRQVNLPAGDLR